MKVRKISFFGHPLFGDLELDFTEQGRTVDTILIAGENGTGKSLLLQTLFRLSNLQPQNDSDEHFEVEVELPHDEEGFVRAFPGVAGHDYRILPVVSVVVDGSKTGWDQFNIKVTPGGEGKSDIEAKEIALPGHLASHASFNRLLKVLFSDVEINFTPRNIGTVTSNELDLAIATGEKSSAQLATEIAQLLVDVESQDALDFTQWAKQNVNGPIDEGRIEVRLKRFTNAFHAIFPSKRYKRIINSNKRKAIIFEEEGRESTIEQLSSGEKQIVFRGGFLLKNRESTRGALVLIDEPEISLHPRWQQHILKYYEKLFTNEEGKQTSQLIVTTHSPFIIHNESRTNDKVVVLQKAADGKVQIATQPTYVGWTAQEAVQQAFYLTKNTGNAEVFIYTEGETDKLYLEQAATLLGMQTRMSIHWIGRLDGEGNAVHTGKSTLDKAHELFLAQKHLLNGKHTVLLYDCDVNKPERDDDLLHVRSLGQDGNLNITKGIEAMLLAHGDLDMTKFYSVENKSIPDGYGGGKRVEITDLKKRELCDHICTRLNLATRHAVLGKLVDALKRVTSGMV